MVERYTAGNGRSRVKGGKDLKRSQAYPRQILDYCFNPRFQEFSHEWCSKHFL
jgi:hypothetical protein